MQISSCMNAHALKGERMPGAKNKPMDMLRYAEPMFRHCSWRAGGVAERFFEPRDVDELVAYLAGAPDDEAIFMLGLGSNLLVRDGGIRGTVISIARSFNAIEFQGSATLQAQAGVACAKIARLSARAGCSGAEFLAGVPGTLGGALAMNAGAFGGETWDIVKSVETLDRKGNRHKRTPAHYEVAYRSVTGPAQEFFISAVLNVTPDTHADSQATIKSLLAQRSASQPTGQASSGSVFKNPPGDFAARLIQSCGLKGASVGAARVSEKHANFIINEGGATATDIESLMNRIIETVRNHAGVTLEPEVKIVGEWPQDIDGLRQH